MKHVEYFLIGSVVLLTSLSILLVCAAFLYETAPYGFAIFVLFPVAYYIGKVVREAREVFERHHL